MTPRQQSILIGAVVTGVLSTSYLGLINFICCLGVIIGGVVAVQQFVDRTRTSVESGDGAVLGALAGAGGALFAALFDQALRPFNLDSQSISQDMMQNFMQVEGQQMSPEMMQQFQGGGSATMILMGLAIGIVVNSIFGAIGGAIGAAIFGGDEQGQNVDPEGSHPGSSQSGGPAMGGTEPGGAQQGPSDGSQDDSAGGATSNREGSA